MDKEMKPSREEVLRIAETVSNDPSFLIEFYGERMSNVCTAMYEAGRKSSISSERAVSDRLLEALKRVVGDHNAPDDCYATGPLIGNPYQDLVACPSCQAESIIAEVEDMRKENKE